MNTACLRCSSGSATGCPDFVEVNPEGGKTSLAAAASPQLESGNWYLPHPTLAPWVEQFIGECGAFPAGAHGD